jgi:flagellar hook-associated protein 2
MLVAVPLGTINVTTRDGNTGSIDLSSTVNLQDVINTITNSGLGLSAEFNESGTGLSIRDLTGGSSSEFSLSSTDGTADRLGITASSLDNVIRGKSLDRKFVSRNTSLDTLNQGRGVGTGSFTITDSKGQLSAINIRASNIKSVGELLDAINKLTVSVTARVNAKGDGIELIDTANGSGTLRVTDSAGQSSAANLRIAGAAERQVVDGKIVQAIDGSQVDRILVKSSDTLTTITDKIQSKAKLASATTVTGTNGSRLQILSQRGGTAGRLAFDDGGLGLQLRNTQVGQDAAIAVGTSAQTSYFYSSDGVFDNAIAGVSITAKEVTTAPVKVSVGQDSDAVVAAVNSLVDQFNKTVDKVQAVSFYNAKDNTTGILFGRGEVLQIQTGFGRLFTDRYSSGGSLTSLQSLGISLNDKGKLELSTSKLRAQLESNPQAVQDLLSHETRGFQTKLNAMTERFSGVKNGLLLNRSQALTEQILNSNSRVDSMNARLDKERERLLSQFYKTETAISKIQGNQKAVDQIARITIPQ